MPAGRILLAGASGYIGQCVARELLARGYAVVCLLRPATCAGLADDTRLAHNLAGAELRPCRLERSEEIIHDGIRGEGFDAVISCIASRSGQPEDAWQVDHAANLNLLQAAQQAGVAHFVLLSAICVQRPRLPFQQAKLAFEEALQASGLRYSIVRPTAFFKSLAGQVPAVKRGKPFAVFGDGELTACKPIAEQDLAHFMVECLEDAQKHDRILPVGGPGPAITPRQQAAILSRLLGREVRLRRVPPALLRCVITLLKGLGKLLPPCRRAAEFARIGHYYATESMLVWDPVAQRYDAEATPGYGEFTLEDFYLQALTQGLEGQELGAHAPYRRDR